MTGVPFQPENIPQALRQFDSWVVWQLRDVGKPKPAKVPVQVLADGSIKNCDASDPYNWLPFDQAVELVQRSQGALSGVGLCPKFAGIPNSDQDSRVGLKLVLLDFDNVGQQIRSDIAQFFEQAELQVEYSPSGNGLRSFAFILEDHPLVRDTVAYAKMVSAYDGRDLGEFFVNAGYCTFTGAVFRENDNHVPVLGEPERWIARKPRSVQGPAAGHELAVGAQALDPSWLTGDLLALFDGTYHGDRSALMLPLLEALAKQCGSAEELADRAWSTPGLRNYFLTKREGSDERAQEFCWTECYKGWQKWQANVDSFGVVPPVPAVAAGVEPSLQEGSERLSDFFVRLDQAKIQEPDWALADFIVRRGTTLFYGAESVGKSWLTQAACFGLASGAADVFGRANKLAGQPGWVIMMLSEGHEGTATRMRAMSNGQVLPIAITDRATISLGQGGIATPLELFNNIEQVRAGGWDTLLPVHAIIVDTFTGHMRGNPDKAEETEAFMAALRQVCQAYGASLVMTHHKARAGHVRGSTNIPAFFDIMWEVDAPADGFTEATIDKARDFDKTKIPPLSIITRDGAPRLATEVERLGKPQDRELERPRQEGCMEPERYAATERVLLEIIRDAKKVSRTALLDLYRAQRETILKRTDNIREHPVPGTRERQNRELCPPLTECLDQLVISGWVERKESGGRNSAKRVEYAFKNADGWYLVDRAMHYVKLEKELG